MYTVTVTPKHTDGIDFGHRLNGALVKACKEQFRGRTGDDDSRPEIIEEYDDYVKDSKGNHYNFSTDPLKGYCRQTFDALKKNELTEIRLTLEMNKIF